MPCPEPSAAGLFRFDEQGVVVPSAEEVRELTEEYARELAGILTEVDHLRRCALYVVDPTSGKTPRTSEKRQALAQRLAAEAEKLWRHYEDALAVYAEAFGESAADALNRFVKENCPVEPAVNQPAVQQELF